MDGSKLLGGALAAAGLLCATGASVAASAGSASRTANVSREAPYDNRMSDHHARRILALHNREREQLGLPKLKWNRALEREAHNYGSVLARKGRLEHAQNGARNGTGENLWMGTAGQWPVETMVGLFIEEKRHYRHGNFPEISRTGKWADVAHYTQVIWRDTQEVGCSVVNERGWDVLVCRYWPAGNVWGRKAY